MIHNLRNINFYLMVLLDLLIFRPPFTQPTCSGLISACPDMQRHNI